MKDELQELRDDRAALLQALRGAVKLIDALLKGHELIEQQHSIGLFSKEDLDRYRVGMKGA